MVDLEYYTVCVSINRNSLESALSVLHEIDNNYEPKFKPSSRENMHLDILVQGIGINGWSFANMIFNRLITIPKHSLQILPSDETGITEFIGLRVHQSGDY